MGRSFKSSSSHWVQSLHECDRISSDSSLLDEQTKYSCKTWIGIRTGDLHATVYFSRVRASRRLDFVHDVSTDQTMDLQIRKLELQSSCRFKASEGTNRLLGCKFAEGKEPGAGNLNSGLKFAGDLSEWELNCMLTLSCTV